MDSEPAVRRNFSYASVERFADWVKYQDAKAGGIAALTGLAAADLLNHVAAARLAETLQSFSGLVFWLALLAAVVTALAVIRVWWPQREAEGKKSLYFWGRVATMEEVEYKNAIRTADAEAIDDAVSSQAWELAKIIDVKTTRVTQAAWAASAMVVLWIAARIMLG